MATTILEEINDDFNPETGEITHQHKHHVRKSDIKPSDEFIKVSKYLNVIFAYNNIPLNLVGIALLLAQKMEFKTNIVYIFQEDKVLFGDMLGLKRRYKKDGTPDTNTVDKLIQSCKKYDIIRPTGTRGKYAVNAYLFSTGNLVETRNLQAQFDFDAQTFAVRADHKNLITGETVRKTVTNKKDAKQIPGQMSFDENYLVGEDNK